MGLMYEMEKRTALYFDCQSLGIWEKHVSIVKSLIGTHGVLIH